MNEAEILQFLKECKSSGVEYREKFRPTWDECENQVRCVPPKAWDLKEDWQSKIFIPMQAKKEEVAVAYLNKMVFGKQRNFDILGVEKADEDNATQITKLIDVLLEIGKFRHENNFALTEGVDIGTSFLKILLGKDGQSLTLTWRSAYNCLIDPMAGHDFTNARFWIDQYKKDIAYLLDEARKPKPMYSKNKIQEFLDNAVKEADAILNKAGQSSSEASKAMTIVKSIDNTQSLTIPAQYKTVDVDEYWVQTPNDKGQYEHRLITVLNDVYILRDDENPYGMIPVAALRIKPRKYDFYGKGYIENTRGLQDLANSCVNLGFDSLKISAMDIIVIDQSKVADSLSIKYKPLAVWKMKDINAVKIQRQPLSAISDILRGLSIIDQIDQEASGVTRQAQGVPSLSGEGTQAETLGEYQLKLSAIDQRFLDVGRFIETDYFLRVINIIFKIITNEKLFSQQAVNRLLGFKEVDELGQDPETGIVKVVGTRQVPKLNLEEIRNKGEMAFDFKATGITQFADKIETITKLKEAMQFALGNPTLTALTKIDILWKKLWQVSEIPDYEDFLRSKEEIREMLSQQQPQQPQMPQPQPNMPPAMQGGM